MSRDDYVIVIDFLPHGHATDRKPEPIAQVIGNKYFSLLEIVIRNDVTVNNGDVIYIGEDKRKEVDHIKGRISINKLTAFARSEIPHIIEEIINNNEERFVNFFNMAQPISTRMHQLELLPGIGKKHMWDIINERKKSPFKSFSDIKERVKLIQNPKELVIKRILGEIENEDEKYRIFVAGYKRF